MNCIVTDARYRMTVSIIRSLGKAGVGVTAVEDKLPLREILGFHSKYVDKTTYVTSAHNSHQEFIQDLLKLSPGHDAVIPVSTNSTLALAKYRYQLQDKLRFLVASEDAINLADDKKRLLHQADEIGIPTPVTTTLKEGEEIGSLADRVSYPVVIKYRAGEKIGLHAADRYRIVNDKESFIAVYRIMHEKQAYPLVQEYLSGDGFGVSTFFNEEGEPVVLFGHRRLREYPVSGGPSCFCQSIHLPEVNRYTVKLLQSIGWKGTAMVEFKQADDGTFRLMEINPRIWGSFPLTLAAGLDFPLIMYKTIMGEKVEPVLETPSGMKMRFLVQDLLSARGYLKRADDKLAFVKGFLRDLTDGQITDGLLSKDDPEPGRYYLKNLLFKVLNR